jgi:hypothetical protein
MLLTIFFLFFSVICGKYTIEKDFNYKPVISETDYHTSSSSVSIYYNFHTKPTSNCSSDVCVMYVFAASSGLLNFFEYLLNV